MATNSRVWLVTGASTGLGRALTEAVLLKGERAVATTRSSASLEELAKKHPVNQLLVIQLDVTDYSAIASAFDTIKDHFGRLDVVVNNAGYGVRGEMESMSDEVARPLFETIFWSPVQVTKHALRFFREVNPKGLGGRVLQITSIAGYRAMPTLSFYSAAKSALESFTLAFTREIPPEWNIKAIIIEPGAFATNWAVQNMLLVPPHPAYTEDAPSRQHLEALKHFPEIGDVQRAAQAMITISEASDPPQRLQLGTDAWGLAQMETQKSLADQEKWASLSHSTNLDGYGMEILDYLRSA